VVIPLNAFNGELDLDASLAGTVPDPGPPTVFGPFLLSWNNECCTEFAPRIGATETYPATYTTTAMPEPSDVALLAAAMLLFAAVPAVVSAPQSVSHMHEQRTLGATA